LAVAECTPAAKRADQTRTFGLREYTDRFSERVLGHKIRVRKEKNHFHKTFWSPLAIVVAD
jgi:hypothetical protein